MQILFRIRREMKSVRSYLKNNNIVKQAVCDRVSGTNLRTRSQTACLTLRFVFLRQPLTKFSIGALIILNREKSHILAAKISAVFISSS